MQGLGQDQSNTSKANPNKRKNGTSSKGTSKTTMVATASNSGSDSVSIASAAVATPNISVAKLIETMNSELDGSNAYPSTKRLKRSTPPIFDDEEDDFNSELYSNLEERLVFKDIQNAYDDLKDFDRIFYLLKIYEIQRLTRITQENDERLKNNPFATPILSETDPKLKKVEILFKIVSELTKKKIEHLNNYLNCNIMFANRYQCPYYLKTEEATEDMRHRISNFLSRCNKKKYGHDRISSWLNDLIHDFVYIRVGLIKKKSDDTIVIN